MPATEPQREDGQQFLSFFFAGEEYATEILRIREVVEYQRLTPVPTTPAWVRGVMNLRGTVVPVLDLATKLQHTETPVEKLTCIVIFEVDLEGEPTPVGVMIDQVGRVFELRSDEIHEPPAFGSPVRPDLLEGIGMVEDKPVPILHIQKVLTEDELAAAVAGTEALEDETPKATARDDRPRTKGPSAKPSKKGAKSAPGTPPKTEASPEPKTKAKAKGKAKTGRKGRVKSRAKTPAKTKAPAKPKADEAKPETGTEKSTKPAGDAPKTGGAPGRPSEG